MFFLLVKQFREKDKTTPIVLMGYANPIEAMGVEKSRPPPKVAAWTV